ncbi:uncharacterized protein EV154DRAFT_513774 [Mucor mucedo]|uniref:uncharacterized protein n=1 Tax=Mucor mucedo TaxID=29922 RepID=UPI00221F94FC|nr:uncharacterized protein EV154DRAFT_513774 [Mucor mucedo]KAI7889694.1 hypothetical protein EV154DRAFT_513774 [Mucor mucedo]
MSDNNPPPDKDKGAEDFYFPLTTEEPVRRPWLRTELKDLNDDIADDLDQLSIEDDDDTTDTSDDDDSEDDSSKNKIKQFVEEEEHEAESLVDCLAQEMADYEARLSGEAEEYEQRVANAESEDELLADDPELLRRTESNRYIPFEEDIKPVQRPEDHLVDSGMDKDLLVFSDQVSTIEDVNRVVTVQYYGAGKSGVMPNNYRNKRTPKIYLVACDFSKESLYAMEWTMGAMMRDGDQLHVATVANREDNPEGVKASGLDQEGEVGKKRLLLSALSHIYFVFVVACTFKSSLGGS